MTTHNRGTRMAAAGAALPLLLALGACAAAPAPSAGVATATDSVTHKNNDRVPEGASWTQHYFPSSDGSDVELHSDVLLPEGLATGEKVPVVLSVGPYFGHAGEIFDDGFEHTGPSIRFNDLVEGTDLFDRGYAFVMVDARGFGGSTGCPDLAGAGDQADIKAAIDWAATQPWSTGSVGMYGKSADAITGLVGNNLENAALKAVVAQEPSWDLLRNMRSNGVPRSTIVDMPRTFNDSAAMPQMPDDDKRYLANSRYEDAHPECAYDNTLGYRTADPKSEYWKVRDLAANAAGTQTPLFFTQGFLEWNTEPDAMDEFLTNHEGPERGWLGPWEHVRGNDRDAEGRLKMGRDGWFAETMAFFDQYLKGVEPSAKYPAYAVQDNTGTWRAQETWPVVDGSATIQLGGGSYLDDGAEGDAAVDTGNSFFTWSEPISQTTRITGTPRLSLDATGNGNLMVKLYDVAPGGAAVLFDEQVTGLSPGTTILELKSTDWTLEAGHVLAVEIGTIESHVFSDWLDMPSHRTITVEGAQLELALDDPADDTPLEGDRGVYLDTYVSYSSFELTAGQPSFVIPPARG